MRSPGLRWTRRASMRLHLLAEGLSPPGQGRAHSLWLVDKSGEWDQIVQLSPSDAAPDAWGATATHNLAGARRAVISADRTGDPPDTPHEIRLAADLLPHSD